MIITLHSFHVEIVGFPQPYGSKFFTLLNTAKCILKAVTYACPSRATRCSFCHRFYVDNLLLELGTSLLADFHIFSEGLHVRCMRLNTVTVMSKPTLTLREMMLLKCCVSIHLHIFPASFLDGHLQQDLPHSGVRQSFVAVREVQTRIGTALDQCKVALQHFNLGTRNPVWPFATASVNPGLSWMKHVQRCLHPPVHRATLRRTSSAIFSNMSMIPDKWNSYSLTSGVS